ncbi:MAG TPA: UDP-N-acetylmuramoyl-tripeptide--D-alanyl-D-alanine ligase [Candidatus Aquilonibacter sp.]|nr:UDP-N-acetylmuramoyl-tripeptide--D-alanyl-D-alanine ligase [Candidatus Aquilonibacter sp.]
MNLPFDVAMSATHATVFELDLAPSEVRVVTDTRSLVPGDTFLALRGERFDGHAFVREAVGKGAGAVIISDPDARPASRTSLVVEDTLAAYMALAAAARARFRGRVLAMTGSAGKTTTKYFSAQLLALRYGSRVLASPANENNEIGVSKLLLAASNERHDVLVVEMGARHYNDIAPLVAIAKPDVAILTNVGDAHLEIMGSRERLEETKWSIFGGGARAIVNARDAASIRRAPTLASPPHWFFAGERDSTIPTTGRVTALCGNELIDRRQSDVRTIETTVRVPGAHNRENLAAAIAAALEYDVDIDAIGRALPDVSLPEGRYERIALPSGVTLIYDAYNANAAGMMAALDAFEQEAAARRIALLSSMAELGEEASELHRRVGAHAAKTRVDVMLVGGEFAAELSHGALRAGLSSERIVPFATNEQAAQWLKSHACEGDAVLLKGSRRYRLEEIVEELQR